MKRPSSETNHVPLGKYFAVNLCDRHKHTLDYYSCKKIDFMNFNKTAFFVFTEERNS